LTYLFVLCIRFSLFLIIKMSELTNYLKREDELERKPVDISKISRREFVREMAGLAISALGLSITDCSSIGTVKKEDEPFCSQVSSNPELPEFLNNQTKAFRKGIAIQCPQVFLLNAKEYLEDGIFSPEELEDLIIGSAKKYPDNFLSNVKFLKELPFLNLSKLINLAINKITLGEFFKIAYELESIVGFDLDSAIESIYKDIGYKSFIDELKFAGEDAKKSAGFVKFIEEIALTYDTVAFLKDVEFFADFKGLDVVKLLNEIAKNNPKIFLGYFTDLEKTNKEKYQKLNKINGLKLKGLVKQCKKAAN
jgi:hypothetical protein